MKQSSTPNGTDIDCEALIIAARWDDKIPWKTGLMGTKVCCIQTL